MPEEAFGVPEEARLSLCPPWLCRDAVGGVPSPGAVVSLVVIVLLTGCGFSTTLCTLPYFRRAPKNGTLIPLVTVFQVGYLGKDCISSLGIAILVSSSRTAPSSNWLGQISTDLI